jgi:prepilin-type N-terminal cleavage/methylation domain-containing protein
MTHRESSTSSEASNFPQGIDPCNPLVRRFWAGAGFTIIELLVVIVVIGILAVIVVVGYNGVTTHAIEVSMKSDLDNASSQLALDSQHGSYPTTAAAANNGQGLATSGGNSLSYQLKPYGYCITITNSKTSSVYRVKSLNQNKIETGDCTSIVSTFAGSGTGGFADGPGVTAQFNGPGNVAVDAAGNIFVSDNSNHRIRKISSTGNVSTLAGSGTGGYVDGSAGSAQFCYPEAINLDPAGNLYVADNWNHRIRKVSTGGAVSTVADSPGSTSAYCPGPSQFQNPQGVSVDRSGTLYVADTSHNQIKKISPTGVVSTFAGTGTAGFADGAATSAQFNQPGGVVVASSGAVYVADGKNCRIRMITPAGVVSTLAGSGTCGYADGTGTAAQFNQSTNVAIDRAGNIYVPEGSYNPRIRMITPSGVVTTLAGTANPSFSDGVATTATFYCPTGVAIDASFNVYVADRCNNRIRMITQ